MTRIEVQPAKLGKVKTNVKKIYDVINELKQAELEEKRKQEEMRRAEQLKRQMEERKKKLKRKKKKNVKMEYKEKGEV